MASLVDQGIATPAGELHRWFRFRRDVEDRLEHTVGGPARLRVVALLACVLALDSADKATVGAVASQLEHSLQIGNTEIGLLAGIGFLVSGDVTAALSWRFSFWVLAIPAFVLAVVFWRQLPEPARGGQSRLEPGDDQITTAAQVEDST